MWEFFSDDTVNLHSLKKVQDNNMKKAQVKLQPLSLKNKLLEAGKSFWKKKINQDNLSLSYDFPRPLL